jgi:hypothetical protein
MTQLMGAVNNTPNIEHGILLAITIPTGSGSSNTYYISNCYKPVVYQGNTYQALGGFLQIADIQFDLVNTNNEITVSLSAIPTAYIENILGQQIKGGPIKIYRVFFDTATQEVKNINGYDQIFQRFNGVITNWSVSEDIQDTETGADIQHTITINASSVLGVLENRISGRRTNNNNYQIAYPELSINTGYNATKILTDLSFSRIEQLKAASFDFGKPTK